MRQLTIDNAVAYLRERGQIPASANVSVRTLGGGVSNTVLLVEWSDDCFIVKKPLKRLAVDDEWIIDQERVFNERDGMRFAGTILPPGSVPVVRFCDEANYVITMSRAVGEAKSWKEQLLEGHIELSIARNAGMLLAALHNGAAGHKDIMERFADPQIFIQGRVDPYFRTIARLHPDLKSTIEEEVDRLLATQLTLIHGDYSAKNLMVQPGGQLMLIDWEIAHFGDPAFDVAFCLALLLLKTIRFSHQVPRLGTVAREFWQSYRSRARVVAPDVLGRTTLSQLGCMMLARIDGKSKAEYVTDDATKDAVREVARTILGGSYGSVDQVIDHICATHEIAEHTF